MTEHLHGYPPCATPAGRPCPPTDLAYAECSSYGAFQSCNPSVVDGIPTGQYRCTHGVGMAAASARRPAKKKAAQAKKKAKPARKAPARKAPAKKAKPAKKAAARKGAKARPKAAAGRKPAKKARPMKKARAAKAKPRKAVRKKK